VLVLLRTAATAAVFAWVLLEWRRRFDGFSITLPAIVGAALLLLVVTSQLPGTEWRSWTAGVNEPIRQQIAGLHVDPHLEPWVVADFGDEREATAAAIAVDGRVVKPAGVPMTHWQVDGAPLSWSPYRDLQQMGATERPHTFMAVALPPGSVRSSRMVVEVRPGPGGAHVAGDFGSGASGRYSGPSLDPGFAGFSLWRWIWNGRDPRVPYAQNLGASYASARLDGGAWHSNDLAGGVARPNGLYRVFVTQQPFGPRTNLLGRRTPVIAIPPGTSRCGEAKPYATTADETPGSPFLCTEPGGRIAYHAADGRRLGASAPSAFRGGEPGASRVIDTTRSAAGFVEVLSAGGPLYVANVYGPSRRLRYSLGFAYPSQPPQFL
jgi:hypothetical protein